MTLTMGLNQLLRGIGFPREDGIARWSYFSIGGLMLGMGILLLSACLAVGKKIKKLKLEKSLRE